MAEYFDRAYLHFSWFVARNLDVLILSMWWIIPVASLAVCALLLRNSTWASWQRRSIVALGLVPLVLLFVLAVAMPLSHQSYSARGLVEAVLHTFVGLGLAYMICIILAVVSAQRFWRWSGVALALLIALHVFAAASLRSSAIYWHAGPKFQTGG
jgi:hypothetical protein